MTKDEARVRREQVVNELNDGGVNPALEIEAASLLAFINS